MSVALEDTLEAEGRSAESVVSSFPDFGLVSLTVEFCTSEEQVVERVPEEGEAAHGEVIGEKSPGRRKRFVKAAAWVVRPT
jgi:hypothetical protein